MPGAALVMIAMSVTTTIVYARSVPFVASTRYTPLSRTGIVDLLALPALAWRHVPLPFGDELLLVEYGNLRIFG